MSIFKQDVDPDDDKRWWRGVSETTRGANVEAHPSASLDAHEARLAAARQNVLQLELEITAIDAKYRRAHTNLLREQQAMIERLKRLDCRAQFVNHFRDPKKDEGGGNVE